MLRTFGKEPFALRLSKGERFTQGRLVEGCVILPFMLRQACPPKGGSARRQAQHERLVFHVYTIMDRLII
jgi:hypothetical protein